MIVIQWQYGVTHLLNRDQRYCSASYSIQDTTHTHTHTMKNYLVQNVLALLLEHTKLAFYISARGDPKNLFLK